MASSSADAKSRRRGPFPVTLWMASTTARARPSLDGRHRVDVAVAGAERTSHPVWSRTCSRETHGSRFGSDGTVIQGPATRDLVARPLPK